MAFVSFLAIVMAFGVEALLPAFDLIGSEFRFDAIGAGVSLLVTAFLVGMGIGTLVWGPVSDRFGRRSVLIVGFALYGVGAVGMALASSIELLLVARVVWGFGAAAPGGLRYAIVRDLYSGDDMARIIAVATAVFMIAPLTMPIVGEILLFIGSWQIIALTGLGLAAVAVLWSLRFGETLSSERRRSLRIAPIIEGARIVGRTTSSAGAIVASVFFYASFFVWLGSAQPIIDRIYGRDEQFVLFFGASGLAMSLALVVSNRVIPRIGTRSLARRSALLFLLLCLVALVATMLDGGLGLWPWFLWAAATNAIGAVLGTSAAALALDPVGEVAGTAASLLNFAALVPGSLLAALVDARISETVTPMVVGSTVFGILGGLALLVSQPESARARPVPADTTGPPISI